MTQKNDCTPREREILLLAAEGLTDKEIANRLGISHATVTTHWVRLRERTGTRSRGEALMKILGEELRRSAAQADQTLKDLHVLIEEAQDYATFSIDAKGKILDWNAGVTRVLGYSQEEFVGKDFSIVFTPEDAESGEHKVEMQEAATRGRYLDKRWHAKKDGTQVWIDGCIVAIRDDHTGQLRKFSKIMRDDTERKGLEEEVQRLQARISKGGFKLSDS